MRLFAAMLALTGCSFMVNGTSARDERPVPCHGAAPIVDVVLATGSIIAGIYVAGAVRTDPHGDPGAELSNVITTSLALGGTAVVTGGFVASAVHGFHKLGQCTPPSPEELAAEKARDEQIRAAQLRAEAEADAAHAHEQQMSEIQIEERHLTDEARAAASTGDCATVKRIDAQLRALPEADPGIQGGFHDTVFLHYSDIVHCLAAPAVDAGVPDAP